jgi:Flp pilus assembly protein TadD
VALLQQAQRLHPDNFWINHDLASFHEIKPPKHEAAIRYYTAAVALRPESPVVHNNLGVALSARARRARRSPPTARPSN